MACDCELEDDDDDWFDEGGGALGILWDYVITPVLSLTALCASLAISALCVFALIWCLGQIADIVMRLSA